MTLIRALAVALALAAIAVPTAQAKFVDIHQPLVQKPEPAGLDYSKNSVTGEYLPKADSGNSATAEYRAAGGTGASGAAAAGPTRTDAQDFRMPDTIDAANGRGPAEAPDVTVVRVPTPTAPVTAPSSDGTDWADAGIGAGGMLAMIVVAGGGALALVHRRRLQPAA